MTPYPIADNDPAGLSPEDGALLAAAVRAGRVEAHLFEQGDFSEAGFLLYGQLEALCARGLLRFQSWSGDPAKGAGQVAAVFTPVVAAA